MSIHHSHYWAFLVPYFINLFQKCQYRKLNKVKKKIIHIAESKKEQNSDISFIKIQMRQ